jgi:DNA-binding MarR family transcriptional regulator
MYSIMNSSESERFEQLYRRIWGALNRPDDPDLSQHERQVLHHVAPDDGVALTWLAGHLGLPKSTTSVLVKSLAARGYVERARDPADERRLAIRLTAKGRGTVERDTVLRPDALAEAMGKLDAPTRKALLRGFEQLADAAESG